MPRLALTLILTYAGTALILLAAVIGAETTGRPLEYFFWEPAMASALDRCVDFSCAYAGFISNVGVLVWIGGAAVCLTVAYLARRRPQGGEAARLFVGAGALTAALALDDVFLLHEQVLPRILSRAEFTAVVGKPERLVFAFYGLATAGLVLWHRHLLARTDVWVLGFAVALFGVSIALDQFVQGNVLAEDGAKLLAIVTWTAYFVGTGLALLSAGDPEPGRAILRPRTDRVDRSPPQGRELRADTPNGLPDRADTRRSSVPRR